MAFMRPIRPSIAAAIIGEHPITSYLNQCQVRNGLSEGSKVNVPPTPEEVRQLIAYLRNSGVDPSIVGSVGVLHYVGSAGGSFRPTVDLDVFVRMTHDRLRKLPPLSGWKVDTASVGVVSWISPSGGYVDFLTAGHKFTDGEKSPDSVSVDTSSPAEYPVATPIDLFRLKLGTMRPKDISDLMSLARAIGKVPSEKELGPLTQTQRENLGLVQQWFKLRPTGGYGE